VNKKLIAAPLIAILFLLATAGAPVLADGILITPMMHDLYESAQRAVILYGNGTEHLILSVSFQGDAEDFAWVIPVPDKPEIAVTDAELFWELSDFTTKGLPSGGGGYGFGCFGGAAAPEDQGGVDVIEEQVVGPYATAILSATNATALADWLNANEYIFPEDGEEIVSEYIEKEWYFVATKINAVEEDTGYALAEGAIEPIVLSFASDEIVYPLRITSLSVMNGALPEVLLYVFTDYVMVPEQYPLYIGYGNWEEEILPEMVSTYLSHNEFYLTKLRGTVSADQMVDIRLLRYEGGDSLNSLSDSNANSGDIVVFATIVGPVFCLYLWRRRGRTTISQGSR
jgi:hypothetical protein